MLLDAELDLCKPSPMNNKCNSKQRGWWLMQWPLCGTGWLLVECFITGEGDSGVGWGGVVSKVSIAIQCYMMQVKSLEELKPRQVSSIFQNWAQAHGLFTLVTLARAWVSVVAHWMCCCTCDWVKFNLEFSEFNISVHGWPLSCL